MKVIQACDTFYPPEIGGAQITFNNIVRKLAEKGVEVEVYTLAPRGLKNREMINGAIVNRFFYTLLPPLPYKISFSYVNAMRKASYDLLHLHGQGVFTSDVVLALKNIFKIKKPIVYSPHGFLKLHFGGFRRTTYFRILMPRLLKRATHYIVQVDSEKEDLIKVFGVPSEKITKIPPGVDEEFTKHADPSFIKKKFGLDSKRIILYVGDFSANKRVDFLIKSIPGIIKKLEDVVFLFVGKHNYKYGEWMKLAEKIGVRGYIITTGQVNEVTLKSAYAAADILVLPSEWEGFGRVLIESLAFGVPFVSREVGAGPELAKKGAGICIGWGNTYSFAQEILRLLTNDILRRNMGERGRKLVMKEFTWDSIVDKLVNLYKRLTG